MSFTSWLRTHDRMSSKRATRIAWAARTPTDLNLDSLTIEFQGESFHERNKMLLSKMLLRILMFCVACGLPISVYAQPGFSGSSVAASVSGTLFDGTTNHGFNSGQHYEIASTGAAILLIDEGGQHGGTVGGGKVEVDASPGRLRVKIEGQARAQGYLQTATSFVRANASFSDTITMLRDRPGAAEIPLGTVIIVNGTMELSGQIAARGDGVFSDRVDLPAADYQNGLGSVNLRIEGVGDGPYGFGEFGRIERGYVNLFPKTVQELTDVLQPIPSAVPWTRAFVWGFPNNIQVSMTLDGYAFAQDYHAGGFGEALGYFFADFSRTLKWGGISSITRYDTGEVLTDLTISSASGFDYSRPFVPEPSGLLLAATAALLLARRRRKRSLSLSNWASKPAET